MKFWKKSPVVEVVDKDGEVREVGNGVDGIGKLGGDVKKRGMNRDNIFV